MARAPNTPKSFNDRMMMVIGVPIVLGWLVFGCYIIWMGTQDQTVIDNIDGYTTLLAIIGGPALIIVTSMLELWKGEQQTEINLHPEIVASHRDEIGLAQAHQRQTVSAKEQHERDLERLRLEHAQMLEHEKQQVELGIHVGHIGHHHEQGVTSTDPVESEE